MNFFRFASLPIMLTALLLFTEKGWAEAWQQTVSAKVSTEYDSNPAMSPSNPEGVSRHLLEPSYALTGNFGRDILKTGLALQVVRSSNEMLSASRNSPTVFVDWLRQGETGEFGITSRYAETSTRNVNTDNTDPALTDNTRSARTLSGRWSKALSQRSSLEVNGSYETVLYSGNTYSNYATRSAGMLFSYLWSESSTPFLRLSRTDYEPASGTSPNSNTDTALAGLSWTASEALSGSLQLGKSRVNNAEPSQIGGGSMRYASERTQLSLSANRQVSPSGFGGFSMVDQIIGSWSYALSEHSITGIDLGWQKNTYITDIISRTSGVWLQHEINSFWGLRTYYQVRNVINAGVMEDTSSYILGFSIAYTHADI